MAKTSAGKQSSKSSSCSGGRSKMAKSGTGKAAMKPSRGWLNTTKSGMGKRKGNNFQPFYGMPKMTKAKGKPSTNHRSWTAGHSILPRTAASWKTGNSLSWNRGMVTGKADRTVQQRPFSWHTVSSKEKTMSKCTNSFMNVNYSHSGVIMNAVEEQTRTYYERKTTQTYFQFQW
ncbi:uncharacterized protein [Ptychodera flava]|uniref:uncharacterized protein isoform X2 n=1 Tax=Ptychodera flava TaxID=63121 RepID=UPI003969C7AE